MLVSAGADMWALPMGADTSQDHQTPIELAWENRHKDLVQHLFGLPNATEPPVNVLDSLISNDNAAQIMQLFIEHFGKASETDASPIRARLIRNIWQEITKRDESPKLGLLALVIRNRPKGLGMGRKWYFQAISQLEPSVENNLVRSPLLRMLLSQVWMKHVSDLGSRHFWFW